MISDYIEDYTSPLMTPMQDPNNEVIIDGKSETRSLLLTPDQPPYIPHMSMKEI